MFYEYRVSDTDIVVTLFRNTTCWMPACRLRLIVTFTNVSIAFRYSMASPLAMPHMTVSPATINGYKIAKDTLVLINLWSGSRDSRVWGEDVDRFNPYRFLDCSTGQVS